MKINKNEQDFVLKYFQPGKLDTRKALQKVKARVGIADKEVSHAATASLRMRRIHWIAVAASILVLFTIGVYTLFAAKDGDAFCRIGSNGVSSARWNKDIVDASFFSFLSGR